MTTSTHSHKAWTDKGGHVSRMTTTTRSHKALTDKGGHVIPNSWLSHHFPLAAKEDSLIGKIC